MCKRLGIKEGRGLFSEQYGKLVIGIGSIGALDTVAPA